eukprot:scaffold11002_cov59-Attheya_sp.AAC.4
MDQYDGVAIDFHQLRRQERRNRRKAATNAAQPSEISQNANDQSKTAAGSEELKRDDPVGTLEQWRAYLRDPSSRNGLVLPDGAEEGDWIKWRILEEEQLSSVYYVPHFLPETYARPLVSWLGQLPIAPDAMTEWPGHWTVLPHAKRRVALFAAGASARGDHNINLPPPLEALLQHVQHFFPNNVPPNHILVNEYTFPNMEILHHTDGPLYYPLTLTLSLSNVSIGFSFQRNVTPGTAEEPQQDLGGCFYWLEGNGSLLRFQDVAYTKYRHGINACDQKIVPDSACFPWMGVSSQDTAPRRISITIRHKF